MKRKEYEVICERVLGYFDRAHIALTEEERGNVEVVDYSLKRFEEIGLSLLVYVNTGSVCAKEMVLFPNQNSPEHRHPPVSGGSGKEETFRCRYGTCYLYVEGEPTDNPVCRLPKDVAEWYTVWHEIELRPGQQHTIMPDTLHWFQAGPEGCIVSEFSTHSDDASDIFTNPHISRLPEVED